MFTSLAPRWRRLLNSVAYTVLVALAAGLGYLTYEATTHRHAPQPGSELPESVTVPLIDIASFSARREKSTDVERLSVALRLRLTTHTEVDCFVYIVARNVHASPKLWAVWPTEAAGAVTAGGHFRGDTPPTGEPFRLTSSWTRLNATFQHPLGRPPFDTVTVYVVGEKGEVLLERPFAL